jgi:hypothetical protein
MFSSVSEFGNPKFEIAWRYVQLCQTVKLHYPTFLLVVKRIP